VVALKRRIWFIVPGEPIAQGRARFSMRSGFVRAYDPKKSSQYKSYVARIAKETYPLEAIDGMVEVEFTYYMPIPKSFTKTKRNAAISGTIRPAVKPDIDNLAKATMDAITGICFEDDKQIVSCKLDKYYSAEPRTEVKVWEV
jgi:Holliday junction resolvase RusA-like endonuclease